MFDDLTLEQIMFDALKPWEQRFVLEYKELVQRLNRLEWLVASIEACTCEFEPKSDLQDLREQIFAMRDYRHVLMKRVCNEELENAVRAYCSEQ